MQRAISTCRRVGLRVCTEFWPHMAPSAHSGMADALGVSLRAPILDRDRATVDQAKFTQSLHERCSPWNICRGVIE